MNESTINKAWQQHASALADRVMTLMVNRTDAWGQYKALHMRKSDEDRTYTAKGFLNEEILVRHFEGKDVGDIIGLFTTSPDNTSRRMEFDIDCHDEHPPEGTEARNFAAALIIFNRLKDMGFQLLLEDSNGGGGYHIIAIFTRPAPTAQVHAFAKSLVADYATLGLSEEPEVFPKQKSIGPNKYGNFLRLFGRHHTRDHWSRFWDGTRWLEGEEAIQYFLALKPSSTDLLPPEEPPSASTPSNMVPQTSGGGHGAGYGNAALQRELEVLLAAPEGQRNDQLNRSAFNLGQLVAGGMVDRATVEDALFSAGHTIGLGSTEIQRTILSGIDSGMEYPRAIPAHDQRPSPSGPQSPEAVATGSGRPLWELPGNGPTITESSETLYAMLATTGRYYRHGGRVVTSSEVDGEIVLRPVTPEMLRSIPETYFTVVAHRAGANGEPVLRPAIMSRETAAAILECAERDRLPEVRGLSACPLLLSDGRVIGPGFDSSTGILVTGGQMPPEVPLAEATAALAALLTDFNFVTLGDRARALAALVTPALRLGGFLPRCPAKINEADQSQTGKGYNQALDAAIYGEIPRLVTQRQGGVGSLDESLGSRLAEGPPFIQFDNLRGKIDSPNLEALLTAERRFPVRIPHRGEIMIDPERYVIFITSNAAEMTPDLANRSYIVRLRKQPEGYRFSHYPEGDLLAHVRANQPYYLGCVFTVVRAWMAAGCPKAEDANHDFRQWACSLGWIVQHLFDAAQLMDGHEDAKARLSNPDRSFVRALAVAVVATDGEDQLWTASALCELAEANDIKIPGLRDWNENQGPKRIGAIMKRVLGSEGQTVIDDYEITVHERDVRREDGGGFFKSKVYKFGANHPDHSNHSSHSRDVNDPENTGISKDVMSSAVVAVDGPVQNDLFAPEVSHRPGSDGEDEPEVRL